jgi:hypothetical protein
MIVGNETWKQAEVITHSAILEWHGMINPDISLEHLICERLREANVIKDTFKAEQPIHSEAK